MNNVVNERTPQVIAAEINIIKHHTQKTVLINAVEIRRRLTEAKALLKHGDWGQWLKESISYSHSTAARLMQIYKEYGPKLLGFSEGDDSSNFATLQNLTYSHALILLGVPEEEREKFVKDNVKTNLGLIRVTKKELIPKNRGCASVLFDRFVILILPLTFSP